MPEQTSAFAASRWIRLAWLAVSFYAGAKLSLAFAVTSEALVMLWLANGILLAALFHLGWRRYFSLVPLVVVAELAADLPTFSLAEAVLFGVINLLEVTIAYALLQRLRFDPRFEAPRDIAVFVLAGPLVAAFTSAWAGAAVYRFFGGIEASFFEFQRVWWFSDGLGLLIVTPLILSVWPPRPTETARFALRWFDLVALGASLLLLGAFAFSHQRMFFGWTLRSFVLLPPVMYAAARFSLRVTALVVVVFACVLLFMTKNGQQPFGDLPIRETLISVQELIFVMSTMSLGLAALLSQQRASARALESRVEERTAQLRDANAELEQLAFTDPLTGLLNRRALFALTRREFERARRHAHPLTLIILDVDQFKAFNDRHGHAAGDLVLQAVAEAARHTVRTSDSLARYGGEEFVIVAPETDQDNGVQLAERLRARLQTAAVTVKDEPLRVTASFGVATLRPDDHDSEDLFRRGDQALYAAKAAGRNRVVTAGAA